METRREGEMMIDDTYKVARPGRDRINIHDSYEVRYWCKEFAVTEQRLLDMVKAVGSMAVDVKRHLGR